MVPKDCRGGHPRPLFESRMLAWLVYFKAATFLVRRVASPPPPRVLRAHTLFNSWFPKLVVVGTPPLSASTLAL